MIIALCGPKFAGSDLVERYLVSELGFTSVDDTTVFQRSVIAQNSDSDSQSSNGRSLSQLAAQSWKADVNLVISYVEPYDPVIPELVKRPYFMLVYVDAPLYLRFMRTVEEKVFKPDDFRTFVIADDVLRFNPPSPDTPREGYVQNINSLVNGDTVPIENVTGYSLRQMERMSRLRILNNCATEELLFKKLRSIDFTDQQRLRPSWDTYFMSIAKLAAERTNCMKRRVGCVIARNKRIIATGYNGTPSGVTNCFEGGCSRCNGVENVQGVGLDLCLCLHAEENAIIEAGRDRCQGATLYCNLFPCVLCSKKIVQSGISRVVFENHYATDAAAKMLLNAGNVVVDVFREKSDS